VLVHAMQKTVDRMLIRMIFLMSPFLPLVSNTSSHGSLSSVACKRLDVLAFMINIAIIFYRKGKKRVYEP
jgi:hypothetical protein